MLLQQAFRNGIPDDAKMHPEHLVPCLAPKATQPFAQNNERAAPKWWKLDRRCVQPEHARTENVDLQQDCNGKYQIDGNVRPCGGEEHAVRL